MSDGRDRTDNELHRSLHAALELRPDDLTLRLHFARMLLRAGQRTVAASHAVVVLQKEPINSDALAAIRSAAAVDSARRDNPTFSPADPSDKRPGNHPSSSSRGQDRFEWSAAESELEGVALTMFVESDVDPTDAHEAERLAPCLTDVGGVQEVKDRLQTALLAPIRHPELRKAFAKNLRGGLLYGQQPFWCTDSSLNGVGQPKSGRDATRAEQTRDGSTRSEVRRWLRPNLPTPFEAAKALPLSVQHRGRSR